MTTREDEMVELLPCRDCAAPCRVEQFGPNVAIREPMSLWLCSNHKMFGGDCSSDIAYFDAEAWNARPALSSERDLLREALSDAREAISSLPEDALGFVRTHPSGDLDNGYVYPIRDELLAKIDAALTGVTGG